MTAIRQIARFSGTHLVPDDARIDRLVFLHLEKAAGKSFKLALDAAFSAEAVSPHTDYRTFAEIAPAYTVAVGHVDRRHSLDSLGPQRWFTVLRDPIDRVLSLMNYWAETAHPESWIYRDASSTDRAAYDMARTGSFEDFVTADNAKIRQQIHNAACHRITGDPQGSDSDDLYAERAYFLLRDDALFFGLQSQFAFSLLHLPLLFELPYRSVSLSPERINTTKTKRMTRADVGTLEPAALKADIALYRQAEVLFHQRVTSLTQVCFNRLAARTPLASP